VGSEDEQKSGIPIYLVKPNADGEQFLQMPFIYDVDRKQYNYSLQVGEKVYVACPGSTKVTIPNRDISIPIGYNRNTFMVQCNADGKLTTNIDPTVVSTKIIKYLLHLFQKN